MRIGRDSQKTDKGPRAETELGTESGGSRQGQHDGLQGTPAGPPHRPRAFPGVANNVNQADKAKESPWYFKTR